MKNTDSITATIIGMSDGLTVPFVLATGLSAAAFSTSVIVTACLVAIVAGALTMALGGYLATKTGMSDYQEAMKEELEHTGLLPLKGEEQVKNFLANIGLNEEMQQKATEEIARDKQEWANFMKRYELGQEKPAPMKAALTIGFSYAMAGLLPLCPYFFIAASMDAIRLSATLTLAALFIFGFLRNKALGLNPWWGALRLTVTGAIAAGAAFAIVRLVQA